LKVLSVVFFIILTALIVAADQGRFPHLIHAIYSFPGGDKIGHFLMMGMMAFLINMSTPLGQGDKPYRNLLIGSLMVAAASSLEEASQVFFVTRTLSLADLLCNYAGIGVFSYAAWVIRARKQNDSSDQVEANI
jgi:polysaccharide biosynthesis protein VpsQ